MEQLTGKAKEAFYEWSLGKTPQGPFVKNFSLNLAKSIVSFIIVKWFDSVGIIITTPPRYDGEFYLEMYEYHILHHGKGYSTDTFFKNMDEAFNAAIEKANEIYNLNNTEKPEK